MIGLLEFEIALSKKLLRVCTNQSSYNSNLIKVYLAYAKQNAAVKTTRDVSSMSVM